MSTDVIPINRPVILNCIHWSFSQLGNSSNFAISVKGKGLTNVKMYVERIFFQKVKFDYKATKYKCQYCSRFSTAIFIKVLF